MIIFYSMIAWVLLLMIFNNKTYIKNGIKTVNVSKAAAFMAMGYIVFWAGMRSQFVDTAAYIRAFEAMPVGLSYIPEVWAEDVKSPGFGLFGLFFKTLISENYHWYLMTIAIITAIPICKVYYEKSCNFFYTMLLFILSTNFIWLFNGIRQFLVVGLLFYCGKFILEKNARKWIISILLLYTIHSSVLIALPIFWFVTDKPFGKRMYLFILGMMGISVFMGSFLSVSDTLLQGTTYEDTIAKFEEDDGVNPIRVLVMSLPVLLAYYKRKEIQNDNNPETNLAINMSTVAAGIYYIGIFTSGILVGRLPMYFILYEWILVPRLIERYYQKQRFLMYVAFAVMFFAFFLYSSGSWYYNSDITGFIK